MLPPAQLKPRFSPEELAVWVREAPGKDAYQRRLAIWLTHPRKPAPEIADLFAEDYCHTFDDELV